MGEVDQSDPPSSDSGEVLIDTSQTQSRRRRRSRPPPRNPPSQPRATLPGEGDFIDGKYRLKSLVGEGGMGAVWVARNETLDIDVAIKFIRADRAGVDSPRLTDRLLREARAAAKLGHPAIVRVHDYGTTEQQDPYLVMELLDGESLHETLERRQRVSAIRALQCLLPIAHALDAAHEKGIVHRDLKPENVLVAQTEHGIQPKLIDFGIVKVDQKPTRLTREGDLVGTPDYFSPEQARGEDSDHRADIWAFCTMVYELVTGRMPFEADNYHALVRAIIEDEPRPITDHAAGDVELWAILARGLSKAPADRWPSMRELGVALAGWLVDRGIVEDVCGASLEAVWLSERSPSSSRDAFESVPPPSDRRTKGMTPAVTTPVGLRLGEGSDDTAGTAGVGDEPAAPVADEAAAAAAQPVEPSRRRLAVLAATAAVLIVAALAWTMGHLAGADSPADGASASPAATSAESSAAASAVTSSTAAPAETAEATVGTTATTATPSADDTAAPPAVKRPVATPKAPRPGAGRRDSQPGLKAPTFD